jgi:hypothetical protein
VISKLSNIKMKRKNKENWKQQNCLVLPHLQVKNKKWNYFSVYYLSHDLQGGWITGINSQPGNAKTRI